MSMIDASGGKGMLLHYDVEEMEAFVFEAHVASGAHSR